MAHSTSLAMRRYSIEPRTRKYVRGYEFLSFWIKLPKKYIKPLMDAATRTGIDVLKTVTKKVAHEAAEATV